MNQKKKTWLTGASLGTEREKKEKMRQIMGTILIV